jgi:predicted dehydrogenase
MPVAYGSYQALIDDPKVDAIYVATPHSFHMEHTMACLKGGKPVLCEKPFAINVAQAQAMIDTARTHKVFLMEAMWSRFLPVNLQVRQWLSENRIGTPLFLMADFGFRAQPNPESRLFNPQLGGGGLLDVGIYPISYAAMVFGHTPTQIQASAWLGSTGVDEQAAMILTHANGAQALLRTGIRVSTEQMVRIEGTQGVIVVPNFWHATEAFLYAGDASPVHFTAESGYHFEAAEVMHCVRAGKLESDALPLDETLAIMRTMDEIRTQIQLTYPME